MRDADSRKRGAQFALLVLAAMVGSIRAAETSPPSATAEVVGATIFREAVAYQANGNDVRSKVENFSTELHDVQLDVEGSHHEGHLRLWFASPDKYRYESRVRPTSKEATVKMLDGNKMWIQTPSGTKAMHKSAEGVAAIRQARRDRDRLAYLSRFLTLGSLLGPKVKFMFRGRKQDTGTFKGDWLRVDRIAADGSKIVFSFAYEKDAKGRTSRATYPGIVTVPGDKAKGTQTEHFILAKWRVMRGFRYPGQILAYAEREGARKRFLLAHVEDVRINTRMDASLFRPRRR